MISQIFLILTCSCPWFFSYHHNSCSLTLILTTRDNPTTDIMCQFKWWEMSIQHDSMRSVCPFPEKQLWILTKLSKITTFKFYFLKYSQFTILYSFLVYSDQLYIFFIFTFILGYYRLLKEKAMAPHSSTLAWKIPWTEEPGGLLSMGSHRVGHDWATSLSLFTFMHWRRKRQPTPVFLPGESQGRGSLVGCCPWGRTESDTTEAT